MRNVKKIQNIIYLGYGFSNRGYQQQDAHEFMRYLLDRLHSELLQLLPYPTSNSPFITPKGTSTIVTAIFGGLLQNEVHCLICGMESKKHDPFLGKDSDCSGSAMHGDGYYEHVFSVHLI